MLKRLVLRISAVAIFFGAAVVSSAQEGAPPQPSERAALKVCTSKNPPPCATGPHPTYAPNPEYSDKARKKKCRGTVILETVVDTDGHTRDIRVIQSLGCGLDEKAVETLTKWTFQPGTQDGKPVPVLIQVEMDFRIY